MPRRKEVPALSSLCLQSLARHMQSVWVKDYSENYLDEYHFRYVMGPFNELGEVQRPGTQLRVGRGGGGGRASGAGALLADAVGLQHSRPPVTASSCPPGASRQLGAGPHPAPGREPAPDAGRAPPAPGASPPGAEPALLPRPRQQRHRPARRRALQEPELSGPARLQPGLGGRAGGPAGGTAAAEQAGAGRDAGQRAGALGRGLLLQAPAGAGRVPLQEGVPARPAAPGLRPPGGRPVLPRAPRPAGPRPRGPGGLRRGRGPGLRAAGPASPGVPGPQRRAGRPVPHPHAAARRRGRRPGLPLAGGAGAAAAAGGRGRALAHPAPAAGGGGRGALPRHALRRVPGRRGGERVAGRRPRRRLGRAALEPPGPPGPDLRGAAGLGAGPGAAAGAQPGPAAAHPRPPRLLLRGRALPRRPAQLLPPPAGLQHRPAPSGQAAGRRPRRGPPCRAAPLGHRPASPRLPPAPALLPGPGRRLRPLPGPARPGAAGHAGLAAAPLPAPAEPEPPRHPLRAGRRVRGGAGGPGAGPARAARALAGREPGVQPDRVAAAGRRQPPARPGPVPLPGHPPPGLRLLPAGRAEAAAGSGHHLGIAARPRGTTEPALAAQRSLIKPFTARAAPSA